MEDRATLEKIYVIMRRVLLIKLDGLNPIPRKGATRRECYRALYEIQELLGTRGYFGKHLPKTNGDRIRSMSDEEMADWLATAIARHYDQEAAIPEFEKGLWLDWLRQEEQP